MKNGGITPRLLCAAGFVRRGAVFADIGTDHAYLPLFLLKEGIISRAVCSDVNEGPLASAKRNAKAAGLSDRCEFVLCDGAAELSGRGITDCAVCGMGGELIADIIGRAPWLYSADVRLILQPMSRQGVLRKFLLSEGFSIMREGYSYDSGRYYLCIEACYTGQRREIDTVSAEIGEENTDIVNKSAQIDYLKAKRASYIREVNGKAKGGANDEIASKILLAIEEKISFLKKETESDDR